MVGRGDATTKRRQAVSKRKHKRPGEPGRHVAPAAPALPARGVSVAEQLLAQFAALLGFQR